MANGQVNGQQFLLSAYELLVQQAKDGVEDGAYTVFKMSGTPEELLERNLGISKTVARGVINQLRGLEVYDSARGPKPDRRLRIDEVSKKKVMEAASGQGRGSSGNPPPTPEPSPLPPGAIELTDPEQLEALFANLSERLDDYLARAEEAERLLAEERQAHELTKQELETAKAEPKVVVSVPEALARHMPGLAQSE